MRLSRTLSAGFAVLLLSSTGFARAQVAPENEPAQSPAPELTPPPLVPAPQDIPYATPRNLEEAAPPPSTDMAEQTRPGLKPAVTTEDPVPRVAVEFIGGTTGGIAGGALGLLVGYLIGAPTVGCDECQVVSLVGGLTGLLIGVPAGTWVGGRLMDGKGTFLATAGGSLVGWGGALLGSAILGLDEDDQAVSALLLLLPIIGATTGYEMSHQANRPVTPPPPSRADTGVRLMPVAGMTEHGARLGLMGRF
ncbi:GlsB/YeaQ/YmgE family stress response membrane protein [Myxococcus landrumensis]|uniref:GlsB/YeaQ/YmgE family stress response membrane protein n=1 Tax=Myxococcus landrumensis TaxID=2813577 RepID=A0ABX7N7F1_9BACT|nr:GlsB/YeaQ/YmgE family stress response membrane protein [Myxococcus landrumus]QSQ13336.1 GlsB/YeaQ/YmgE family stress response membrane protein [Myxococcus landrumus]